MIIAVCLLVLAGCKHNHKEAPAVHSTDYTKVLTPEFLADSAYSFVEGQLAFGFRHPGTKGHEKCAEYIVSNMSRWCDTVIVQPFSATLWDGSKVSCKNIIASINPDCDKRVLLTAHWDSRRWADHDLDTDNWRKPLLGANDGASGVAVIMEMARVMSAMPPDVGVDFVFFDAEDQGIPEWTDKYEDNTWCKGSQFWASSPHRLFYRAEYGILYDMVGCGQPRFTKEEVSMTFAQGLMNKMWNVAEALGYGNVFVNSRTPAILDDHLYVNQILKIPTIDVVQNSQNCSFYPHWHTVNDNLDAVEKGTMKIVATVSMKLIYSDFPQTERQ
ncbi:MAG: M28 family peptidase [Bacteroidales bacterium]|nr:M28 family peptidase [Bacteroidales bacterium]